MSDGGQKRPRLGRGGLSLGLLPQLDDRLESVLAEGDHTSLVEPHPKGNELIRLRTGVHVDAPKDDEQPVPDRLKRRSSLLRQKRIDDVRLQTCFVSKPPLRAFPCAIEVDPEHTIIAWIAQVVPGQALVAEFVFTSGKDGGENETSVLVGRYKALTHGRLQSSFSSEPSPRRSRQNRHHEEYAPGGRSCRCRT
jgi:hypothetical protein